MDPTNTPEFKAWLCGSALLKETWELNMAPHCLGVGRNELNLKNYQEVNNYAKNLPFFQGFRSLQFLQGSRQRCCGHLHPSLPVWAERWQWGEHWLGAGTFCHLWFSDVQNPGFLFTSLPGRRDAQEVQCLSGSHTAFQRHCSLELSNPSLWSKGLQLKGLQEVLGVGGGICTPCNFFCQTTVHIVAKSLLKSGGAGQAQHTGVQRD